MRTLSVLIVSILLALVVSLTPAQAQEPPPIRDFDEATVSRLGEQMYRLDQAAWHATDVMLASEGFTAEGLVGWIVVPEGDDLRVRFGRGTLDALVPAYDIVVDEDNRARMVETGPAFTPDELAMFRAVRAASAALPRACAARYNSIVMADVDGDGWLVWLMASTTRPNVVVAGGHFRFTLSAAGEVEQVDALSRGCLEVPIQAPEGGRPVGIMLNHLVSDRPIETHVFLSLGHRLSLFVRTPDETVFEVSGRRIREARP